MWPVWSIESREDSVLWASGKEAFQVFSEATQRPSVSEQSEDWNCCTHFSIMKKPARVKKSTHRITELGDRQEDSWGPDQTNTEAHILVDLPFLGANKSPF